MSTSGGSLGLWISILWWQQPQACKGGAGGSVKDTRRTHSGKDKTHTQTHDVPHATNAQGVREMRFYTLIIADCTQESVVLYCYSGGYINSARATHSTAACITYFLEKQVKTKKHNFS